MAIYELRTYRLFPHNRVWAYERFRTGTVRIFEKLGIVALGFWTVAVGDGEGDLVYLVRWESYEERERAWRSLASDPEWHEIRRVTEEMHGELVGRTSSILMAPTDFSKLL